MFNLANDSGIKTPKRILGADEPKGSFGLSVTLIDH